MPPASLCTRCAKRLPAQAVRIAGMQFHPHCFICDGCKKPLAKSVQHKKERLYHPECYQRLFSPKCKHCQQFISGAYVKAEAGAYHKACYEQLHQLVCALCKASIEGPYLQDPWGQKAHPSHGQDPTASCHVCARLVQRSRAKILADQRCVCEGCQATEIIHAAQINRAKVEVIEILQSVGFDYIPDYVKVEMYAEQQLINERLRASATGNIHGYTRTAQRNIPGYGLILEHSIHVLNGMPRIAFMGVLAHELLHVWINERHLKHLKPQHVEGFCNLATALMYTQAPRSEDREEQALAKVLLQRLAEDTDPVYGDGYRLMSKVLAERGWPDLLQAMRIPQAFDEVSKTAETATPQSPLAQLTESPPTEKLRQATSSAESAQRLAEIKARVQAKMQQVREGSQIKSVSSKPASSQNTGKNTGLKKLGKKNRKKP
jgi:hypothetical protein